MSDQKPEIRPVQIGNRLVGPGHPVYIVAELSANHRQNYDEAVRLIHAAREAGADAVKLQTYTPDTMTIDCNSEPFCHGKGSLWKDRSLYELYKEAYMPWEWQPKLMRLARELDIDFFSTAYDATSLDFLETLGVPAYKIASFELVDLPLIKRIAKTGKPIFMSTGMATLQEIEAAVAVAADCGADQLILLKCTSAYPASEAEMSLRTPAAYGGSFRFAVRVVRPHVRRWMCHRRRGLGGGHGRKTFHPFKKKRECGQWFFDRTG
jgi:pseudaminic acid synthase